MPSGKETRNTVTSKPPMSFDDALLKALNHSTTHHAFDGYILPGFRVWQLCAILFGIAIVIGMLGIWSFFFYCVYISPHGWYNSVLCFISLFKISLFNADKVTLHFL